MKRCVFILLSVVVGCDQAATESNLVTSQSALTEEAEVTAVVLDDEVPLHEQVKPDPPPPVTPTAVDLELEEVLAALAATPEGAAAMTSVGRRPADGPRQVVEPTRRDEERCQTGAPSAEVDVFNRDDTSKVAVDTAIRDRSPVPLLTRLGALPPHELAGNAEAVLGPETPVPLSY